jgi:hypothetical protein
MGEAFIDLFYRGLSLGSRARMAHIDGRSAFVELPGPMPIGTALSIQVDGLAIPARVIEIVEQTAGSERAPGMKVKPVLEGEAERKWWASASGGELPPVEERRPVVAEAEPVKAKPVAVLVEEKEPADEPAKEAKSSEVSALPDRPVVAEEQPRAPAPAPSASAHDTVEMQAMPEHLAAAIAASEESTDVHPLVNDGGEAAVEAADATVDAPVTDEPSGVVDAESPEPPTAGGDAAPRGRKSRRKRR